MWCVPSAPKQMPVAELTPDVAALLIDTGTPSPELPTRIKPNPPHIQTNIGSEHLTSPPNKTHLHTIVNLNIQAQLEEDKTINRYCPSLIGIVCCIILCACVLHSPHGLIVDYRVNCKRINTSTWNTRGMWRHNIRFCQSQSSCVWWWWWMYMQHSPSKKCRECAPPPASSKASYLMHLAIHVSMIEFFS